MEDKTEREKNTTTTNQTNKTKKSKHKFRIIWWKINKHRKYKTPWSDIKRKFKL